MSKSAEQSKDKIVLLGRDYGDYGRLHVEGDRRLAAAISTGADPRSPSLAHKGDPRQPNEDAALIVHRGARCLLAVADAHHGNEASHALISALADSTASALPADHEALDALVARAIASARDQALDELESGRRRAWPRSRTTLCAVVLDLEARRGCGLGFGDSRCARLGADGGVEWLSSDNYDFVAPFDDEDEAAAERFTLAWDAGDLIVLFSDGVHECCYTRADLSIGESHLSELAAAHRGNARDFVAALGALALEGVDEHPGGEDNLVALATSV